MADEHPSGEIVKVDIGNPDMAIDTPMVMWHLHGFGHLTEGVSVDPGPGSGGGGSPGLPPTPSAKYVAICDSVVHPADLPGVLENGVWMSAFHDEAQPAFNDANVHDHDGLSLAKVFVSVGATLVGPLSQA